MMSFLQLIGSALFTLCFYLLTAFFCLLLLPISFLSLPIYERVGRSWSSASLWLLKLLCGIDHRIEGVENLPKAPFIAACKHQSTWDTLILPHVLLRPSYILKKELTQIPIFGWHMRKLGNIAVDRSAGSKALRSMLQQAEARSKEGRSIVIYPEGTRTAPGQSRSYHPGVAALYKTLDLPVVPIALNSGLFWGRLSLRKKPGTITLRVLPPIAPGLDRKTFQKTLQDRVEEACQELNDQASQQSSGG